MSSFNIKPDPRVLHTAIEEGRTALLSQEWCGQIVMEHSDEYTGVSASADIMQYTNKTLYNNSRLFRFCPITYPPNSDGIAKLRAELKKEARERCGAEINVAAVKKTTGSNQFRTWVLRCKHSKIYNGKKVDAQTKTVVNDVVYCNASLHNDRKNCRPNGTDLACKSNTQCRLDKSKKCCPFSLTIFQDEISYYVKGGIGCNYHKFHLRLNSTAMIRTPTNSISKEETSILASVGSANASIAVGRNLYYLQGGSILSKNQVNYIFTKGRNPNNTIAGEQCFPSATQDKLSATDSMVQYLRDSGSSYCVLYHHQGSTELRENRPVKSSRKKVSGSSPAAGHAPTAVGTKNYPIGIDVSGIANDSNGDGIVGIIEGGCITSTNNGTNSNNNGTRSNNNDGGGAVSNNNGGDGVDSSVSHNGTNSNGNGVVTITSNTNGGGGGRSNVLNTGNSNGIVGRGSNGTGDSAFIINEPNVSGLIHESHLAPSLVGENGTVNSCTMVLPPSKLQELASEFSNETRLALGINDHKDMALACAWVLPEEVAQFRLFPHILHLDTTSATNSEQRPLLTVTGQDSNGKMFFVLRALLPNERAWVFRWIFQHAFPTLLQVENLKSVKLIVTDGDSQEMAQLDAAIPLYMPNARRIRCIWHIVDRGWARYAPGPTSIAPSVTPPEYQSMVGTLKAWMYSWSWPDHCESKEEFDVSKALFKAFINSDKVKAIFTPSAVIRLNEFYRNHVEPHEEYYCSYKNRHIFHLDTTSNTAHEGTNNGIKYCAARVLPTNTVDNTVRILSMNAKIKAGSNTMENARNATSHNLWSLLPTADRVTSLAESLIINQWKERDNYECHKVGHKRWLLKRKLYKSTSESPIPRFQRIRTVQQSSKGSLWCSCCYFERVGIPCWHQLSVLCLVDHSYAGPSFHDVKVFWWKDYATIVQPNNESINIDIRSSPFQLRDNDIDGPLCPFVPTRLEYAKPGESFDVINWPAWRRLLNYSEREGKAAFVSLKPSTSGLNTSVVADMTQETSIAGEDDDDDDGIVFPDTAHVATTQKSSYAVLMPVCKEIITLLEGTGADCYEEVKKSKKILDDLLNSIKSRMPVRTKAATKVGRFDSSNPQSNKRRRTHGTSYGR